MKQADLGIRSLPRWRPWTGLARHVAHTPRGTCNLCGRFIAVGDHYWASGGGSRRAHLQCGIDEDGKDEIKREAVRARADKEVDVDLRSREDKRNDVMRWHTLIADIAALKREVTDLRNTVSYLKVRMGVFD